VVNLLPKPLQVTAIQRVSGGQPAKAGLPGRVHREDVSFLLEQVNSYGVRGDGRANYSLHICTIHVYPQGSCATSLTKTLPRGFHLDAKEVCIAADKLHKVIESRILVTQGCEAEVRFIATRADLGYKQAKQPLAPVPDVIRYHYPPRWAACMADQLRSYLSNAGQSMPDPSALEKTRNATVAL
jgi:hypothetical protein